MVKHRVTRAAPRRPRLRGLLMLVPLSMVLGLLAGGVMAVRPTAAQTPAGAPAAAPAVEARGGSMAGETRAVRAVACDQLAGVAELPLRRRLAQLVMVGVDPSSNAEALAVVRDEQVGGIFIPGTETGLLSDGALTPVQDAAEIPVLVSVDDEGGRVQRIDELDGSIPSAREMAATMTPAEVRELARDRGAAMLARGVTMDLAPIFDVTDAPDGAVIGDRSFSPDPAVAAEYARAFADGLLDVGVRPAFKHFPGHGNASGDSHEGAVTTPPLDELRANDLVPYQGLTGADGAVMLGHLQVPGLTEPETPASVSPAAVRLLRGEMGFDGMVMTDDLEGMRAITDRLDLPEAVREAIAAGVDMALWISADRLGEVLDHLAGAVASGALPEQRVNEGVAAVLRFKNVDACALPGRR